MSAVESPAQLRSRPAPLACYSCRSKHLRCDGVSPVCSRCSSAGLVCTYVPSRRGRPARTRKSYASHASRTAQQATVLPIEEPSEGDLVLDGPAAASVSSIAATCNPFTPAETSPLVSLYNSRFHPSHPMLVPRAHFTTQQYPDYLVLAVCLVGHHFASHPPSPSLVRTAASLAESSRGAHNVHRKVQALLLCALVTSSASKQSSPADEYITKAAQMACAANLHCLDTNFAHESTRSIRQESLRRTWWELYIVDAILALLRHRPPSFLSISSSCQPFMPSSESQYETGELSTDKLTYADFENRILMQTPPGFPSYCYRIHAAVIIRRVCPLPTGSDLDPDDLEAADQAKAAWNLDSPKPSFVSRDSSGEVDYMLLQAHLLVQVAAIFLYAPHTNLPVSARHAMDVTCLRGGGQGTEAPGLHAAKSVAASEEICNLAAATWLRGGVHTPLLLCGFVLGCAVQIAASSGGSGADNLRRMENRRRRVVLMLSALKFLGETWPLAQVVLSRFQLVADAVFNPLNAGSYGGFNRSADSCIAVDGSWSEIAQQDSRGDCAESSGPTGGDYPCNIDWFDFFACVDAGDSLLQNNSES